MENTLTTEAYLVGCSSEPMTRRCSQNSRYDTEIQAPGTNLWDAAQQGLKTWTATDCSLQEYTNFAVSLKFFGIVTKNAAL